MFTLGQLDSGSFEANYQFHIAQRSISLYASDPDHYRYASDLPSGLDTIEYVLGHHKPPIRVLDIGAGHGTFLAAAHDKFGAQVELVGINAEADEADTAVSGAALIHWIEGDFQRPSTWSDRSIHQREAFDLIVTNNTFYQFIDPIAAVASAHRMLRQNGSMFIDRLALRLDPEFKNTLLNRFMNFVDLAGGSISAFGQEDEFTTEALGLYFRKENGTVPRLPYDVELWSARQGPTYRYTGPEHMVELDDRPLRRSSPVLNLSRQPLTVEDVGRMSEDEAE